MDYIGISEYILFALFALILFISWLVERDGSDASTLYVILSIPLFIIFYFFLQVDDGIYTVRATEINGKKIGSKVKTIQEAELSVEKKYVIFDHQRFNLVKSSKHFLSSLVFGYEYKNNRGDEIIYITRAGTITYIVKKPGKGQESKFIVRLKIIDD